MSATVSTPDDLAALSNALQSSFASQLSAQSVAFSASQAVLVGRIAALEAEVGVLEAAQTPTPAAPEPDPHEVVNFTQDNNTAGFLFKTGSLLGKGMGVTTYDVAPGSSTRVPPTTGTNPYRVVRVGAESGSLQSGVVVADLTVQGYAGHNTHGITIGYTQGAVVRGVQVLGAHGTGSSPPLETFGLELWNASAPTVSGCVIDGQKVAGTLLGFNNVDGGTVIDVTANNTTAAFGGAFWQSGNLSIRNCDFRNNRRALNFEQCYGTVTIENCDFRGRLTAKSAGPDIVFTDSGYTPQWGSLAGKLQTTVTARIVEPVWDRSAGPFIIGVPPLNSIYSTTGKPETEPAANITVVIDGEPFTGPQDGSNGPVKIGNYWNG